MHRLWFSVLTCVLTAQLVACGGDDGGVAEPPAVGENGSSELDEPGDVGAQLGTCRKLCCSDADCGSALVCTAFDAASGTLGVCATGSDTTTSADPPAGAS